MGLRFDDFNAVFDEFPDVEVAEQEFQVPEVIVVDLIRNVVQLRHQQLAGRNRWTQERLDFVRRKVLPNYLQHRQHKVKFGTKLVVYLTQLLRKLVSVRLVVQDDLLEVTQISDVQLHVQLAVQHYRHQSAFEELVCVVYGVEYGHKVDFYYTGVYDFFKNKHEKAVDQNVDGQLTHH